MSCMMCYRLLVRFLVIAVCSALVGLAHADVVIEVIPDPRFEAIAPGGLGAPFGSGGQVDEVVGITVTASFADGFTETAVIERLALLQSRASGTDWFVGNDSVGIFGFGWYLSHNRPSAMTGLLFDTTTNNSVFDRARPEPLPLGTPGTGTGQDFGLSFDEPDPGVSITATYSGVVSVPPSSAFGDAFRFLDIDFGAGLGAIDDFNFVADTDSLVAGARIRPVAVPEPGAVFFLAGLGIQFVIRRRRKSPPHRTIWCFTACEASDNGDVCRDQ